MIIILDHPSWEKLFFIVPEIIDRIAKKHFDQNKNTGVVILNVFYDLYNGIIDFNSKIFF